MYDVHYIASHHIETRTLITTYGNFSSPGHEHSSIHSSIYLFIHPHSIKIIPTNNHTQPFFWTRSLLIHPLSPIHFHPSFNNSLSPCLIYRQIYQSISIDFLSTINPQIKNRCQEKKTPFRMYLFTRKHGGWSLVVEYGIFFTKQNART